MAEAATVPLTVTPDAAAHIAELGMQGQFEEMLDHSRRVIPGLRALEVSLQDPYDLGGGPCVIIDALRDCPREGDDPTQREWGFWQVRTFPPQVCENFCLLCVYGAPDER